MPVIISLEFDIKRENEHTSVNVRKAAITQTGHVESDLLCSAGKDHVAVFTYVRSATQKHPSIKHILMNQTDV